MIVVRRIGDTWVVEDSGRCIAQAETRLEAEALEAQWLVYWNQSSDLANCHAQSPALVPPGLAGRPRPF
jgi:hypothetical protein